MQVCNQRGMFTQGAFQVAQWYRIRLPMQESWVWSLSREDPLEEGMATHSSILTWEIPWTEEPGRLQSMRSQRVWWWLSMHTSLYQGEWSRGISTQPAAAAAKSLQSCPTLCDPTDGSPPGSPVPGILQARTLDALIFKMQQKQSHFVNFNYFLLLRCSQKSTGTLSHSNKVSPGVLYKYNLKGEKTFYYIVTLLT